MITILFSLINKGLSEVEFSKLLNELPPLVQDNIMQYKLWEDRVARLTGKLLLKESMQINNASQAFHLNSLQVSEEGKLFTNHSFHFSLAYSGSMAICASSNNAPMGIDIELNNQLIDITLYEDYFTAKEWQLIHAQKTCHNFIYYWTRKEAVLKAMGTGLLKEDIHFEVINDHVIVEDEEYFIQTIPVLSNYTCHIASKLKDQEVKVIPHTIGE